MNKHILKFVLPALVFGAVNFGGTSASAETIEVPADIKSVISTNFEQPEIEKYDFWHKIGRQIDPRRRERDRNQRERDRRDSYRDGYGHNGGHRPPPPPPPRHYPPPPPPGARGPHHPPGRPYPPPPPPPRHRAVQDIEVNALLNINDNVTVSDTVQS